MKTIFAILMATWAGTAFAQNPATIGQAMLSACAAEFNRQVMAYWVVGASLEQTDRAMRKDTLGLAIQIVLKNRKAKSH
jgi:hypothetical protein